MDRLVAHMQFNARALQKMLALEETIYTKAFLRLIARRKVVNRAQRSPIMEHTIRLYAGLRPHIEISTYELKTPMSSKLARIEIKALPILKENETITM